MAPGNVLEEEILEDAPDRHKQPDSHEDECLKIQCPILRYR